LKRINDTGFICFASGLLAFSYILIRSINVGVTYDEAWTIETFVPQSVLNILSYTPCDANNHLANTLLIKLFFLSGNESLFVARLPNLLAFILYLIYAYKIISRFLAPLTGVCCFIALLINPFQLEFFSLARGYGLSLGFLMTSMYYAALFTTEPFSKHALKAIVCGALAFICNFSVLNFVLSLFIVIPILSYRLSDKTNFVKIIHYVPAVSLLLIAITFDPLHKLINQGKLYYGGDSGFYPDTLMSLARYSSYNADNYTMINYLLNAFLVLFIASAFLSFMNDSRFLSAKYMFLAITGLCILSVIAQHYLLGTKFLTDRTALFFYPLLILTFCFLLSSCPEIISKQIILLILLAMGYNFFRKSNLFKTTTWYFDAHSSELINYLNEKGRKEHRKIRLDFSWPFQNSIPYYFRRNNYQFIELVNGSDETDNPVKADYYIYLSKSLERAGYDATKQKILGFKKVISRQYENENIIIYEKIRR
jgi:hypothetical protein